MRIIKCRDYEDMSRKAANLIGAMVTGRPDCVLGLATGSTPLGIYESLIRRYESGDLDFSAVKSVNLDEYRGLGEQDPQSYRYYMRENFFRTAWSRTAKRPARTTMRSSPPWAGWICSFWASAMTDISVLTSPTISLIRRRTAWIWHP